MLRRIKSAGDIFLAWSDEPWILDGAAVRVSIIGFDDGSETQRLLDGQTVPEIGPSLTAGVDVTSARAIQANEGKAHIGIQKGGPFDVPGDTARSWLHLPNPSGVSNREVLKRYANGVDITRRSRDRWIIDFDQMPMEQAARYVVPFAHVEARVKPTRVHLKRESYVRLWWLHQEPRPEMREALAPVARYMVTIRHAKHRVFVWLDADTLPDSALAVVASDDQFVFGVLQSHIHSSWALALGSSLEDRPRYTPSTCFGTYPFPEPTTEERKRIAAAAEHLHEVRGHLLAADENLTLTKLYNEVQAVRVERDATARAFPLLLAHDRLDEAVAGAYGWQWPLDDDEVLRRLLGLNLAMSGGNTD